MNNVTMTLAKTTKQRKMRQSFLKKDTISLHDRNDLTAAAVLSGATIVVSTITVHLEIFWEKNSFFKDILANIQVDQALNLCPFARKSGCYHTRLALHDQVSWESF